MREARKSGDLSPLEVVAARITQADIYAFQRQQADRFAYWAKLEYWTREESVALLLGKLPDEIPQIWKFLVGQRSGLKRRYEELQKLTKRAESMNPGSGRLRPADVLRWATSIGHAVPMDLIAALDNMRATLAAASDVALTKPSEPKLASESEPAPVLNPGRMPVPAGIQTASAPPTAPAGRPKWTPERRVDLLREFRAMGGKRPTEAGKSGQWGALAKLARKSSIHKDTAADQLDKAIAEKKAADMWEQLNTAK